MPMHGDRYLNEESDVQEFPLGVSVKTIVDRLDELERIECELGETRAEEAHAVRLLIPEPYQQSNDPDIRIWVPANTYHRMMHLVDEARATTSRRHRIAREEQAHRDHLARTGKR